MEILYFEKLDSTHKFLLKNVRDKKFFPPLVVLAKEQTDAIGTKGRSWISLKGNLFLSMLISKDSLPLDLPTQSVSIYFGYILKEILQKKGSKVWLKWPNDFYLEDKKIGGVLSQIIGNNIIVSIGLNIKKSPEKFQNIDINISILNLVEEFILHVKEGITWKNIFSKYQVEFAKSKSFDTTMINGKKTVLKNAVLQEDGSVNINGKKVYSNDE